MLVCYTMPVERVTDKTEERISEYIKEKILANDKRFQNPMKLTFDKVLQYIIDEAIESAERLQMAYAEHEADDQNYKALWKDYKALYKIAKQNLEVSLMPEDTSEKLKEEYERQSKEIKNKYANLKQRSS